MLTVNDSLFITKLSMTNQACISIGIDRYQFFPQLECGMADAEAMEQFFINAAGWSQSQCLLLTDTSRQVGDKSTYPDRENINRWLKRWSWDTLHAGDLLWFFFSGGGVSFEGEDYLIPIDGKPEDIANTCISIRQLYQQFHDMGVKPLVLLDANRAQNASIGGGIGTVTTELAQKYEIPTFLSCQVDEFSHEDTQLGQGLFTTALLEALSYHSDFNLETIEAYLTSRSIELSEHHWKPLQTPMAIVPQSFSGDRPVFSPMTIEPMSATIPEVIYTPPAPAPLDDQADSYESYIPPRVTIDNTEPMASPEPMVNPEPMVTNGLARLQPAATKKHRFQWWAKVSFVVTLVLGAGGGVYALKYQSPRGREQPIVRSIASNLTNPNPANFSAPPEKQVMSISRAKIFIKPGDATSRYQAILAARKIPANTVDAIAAQQSIEQWSQEIYTIAQGYADRQLWRLAIDTAKMVPPSTTNYHTVKASMSEWGSNL
jgi:Caspase domain